LGYYIHGYGSALILPINGLGVTAIVSGPVNSLEAFLIPAV
jgi:hypothetical protein